MSWNTIADCLVRVIFDDAGRAQRKCGSSSRPACIPLHLPQVDPRTRYIPALQLVSSVLVLAIRLAITSTLYLNHVETTYIDSDSGCTARDDSFTKSRSRRSSLQEIVRCSSIDQRWLRQRHQRLLCRRVSHPVRRLSSNKYSSSSLSKDVPKLERSASSHLSLLHGTYLTLPIE
jgi:hypothetical protein